MPFSLKHIPQWNAIEIKTNGKNTSSIHAQYMDFMSKQKRKVQPDDFTYLLPEGEFDKWMKGFSYVTTMTQTVGSIKGTEKPSMPEINYELKHIEKMKLRPYPFQEIGISYLVSVGRGILGDEMG